MTIDTLLNPHAKPTPTAEQVRTAFNLCLAVAETVREVGSAPEGPIYAALQTKGATLQDFEAIVNTLSNAGLIARTPGNLLKWTGPKIVTPATK